MRGRCPPPDRGDGRTRRAGSRARAAVGRCARLVISAFGGSWRMPATTTANRSTAIKAIAAATNSRTASISSQLPS